MAAQKTQCPLFTQRHIHHSPVWMLKGFSVPSLCLACATERLEDRTELALHHRRVLGELQALLAAKDGSIIHMLSSDRRVLDHFSTTVFGLLAIQGGTIAQLAMEVLGLISSQFSTTELPRKLMQRSIQTIMATNSLLDGLPYLTFLGRLLHSLPPLCTELAHSFGGFLEYLLRGLAYPDEDLKSAVVYVLVQLSMKTPHNSLPATLVQAMCGFISSNLASAKSHTLTLNLLGLVKGMLKSSAYAQCLLQTDRHTSDAKGSTIASAFKRVLLSSDETLQLSGVQCVSEVLSHHPQYGQTLLRADIAEFMFEALSSKKEPLMLSLFSCLNLLATVDDFYLKGHTVYGIDQVVDGVAASLETKNYKTINLGLTFLSTILQRQPTTMSLFTSASNESLKKLLTVVYDALHTPATQLALPALITFSHLLCTQHLSPGFPLPTLLPLLSLILHLLELHVLPDAEDSGLCSATTTCDRPPSAVVPNLHQPQLLTAVLKVMENMHKVCLEAKISKYVTSEDVTTFLLISFEETIMPSLLLKAEIFDHCGPFAAFFNIARIQLGGLTETPNNNLAIKLANLGFIHFSFDVKSRFFTAPGGGALCGCINECVELLCASLEADPQRRPYVRELLHSALPEINCEMEKSLELFLCRPIGSNNSLGQLQRAVLALFSLAGVTHQSVTSAAVVLQALDRFMVLNPDIHLMPAASLGHLTTLYAVTVYEAGGKSASYNSSTEGSQILVRALLRVATSDSIFSPKPHLLRWVFSQPLLQGLARSWFWQWLKSTCVSNLAGGEEAGLEQFAVESDGWRTIVEFIRTTHALDVLLEVSGEEEMSLSLVSFLNDLLTEQLLDSHGTQKVFSYLQKVLVAQRIHPLSEGTTASLMRLLAKSAHCMMTLDLKLVYHAINFVTRCSSELVESGLALLCEVLNDSKEVNSQVLGLVQNTSFLAKIVSCVPTSSKPKDHSTLSAHALRLIASLIHHQHKNKLACNQSGETISLQSTLAILLHHSTTVMLSGLYFWRVVLSTGGYTGCFTLCNSDQITTLDQDKRSMKRLQFLLQNCLVKDDQAVREASSLCLVQFFTYLSSIGSDLLGTDCMWRKVLIDHISTTSVHSHIPVYYLPFLECIICQTAPDHSGQLKDMAQMLYESVVNEHHSMETSLVKYTSCLHEIQKIDKGLLDLNQWTHLNQFVQQTHHS